MNSRPSFKIVIVATMAMLALIFSQVFVQAQHAKMAGMNDRVCSVVCLKPALPTMPLAPLSIPILFAVATGILKSFYVQPHFSTDSNESHGPPKNIINLYQHYLD